MTDQTSDFQVCVNNTESIPVTPLESLIAQAEAGRGEGEILSSNASWDKFQDHLPGVTRWEGAKVNKPGHTFMVVNRLKANSQQRRSEDVEAPTALFVDFDNGSLLEQLRWVQEAMASHGLPTPILLVWTGGRGFHFYWPLEEGVSLEEWDILQHHLVHVVFKGKADGKCTDRSRLMRAPGFAHGKTGKIARWGRLSNHQCYRVADFPSIESETTGTSRPLTPFLDSKSPSCTIEEKEALTLVKICLEAIGSTIAEGNGTYEDALDICQCYFAAAREKGWSPDVAGLEKLLSSQGAEKERVAALIDGGKNYSAKKTGGGLWSRAENAMGKDDLIAALGRPEQRRRNTLPKVRRREQLLAEAKELPEATPMLTPSGLATQDFKAISLEEMLPGQDELCGNLRTVTASLPPQYDLTTLKLFLSTLSAVIRGPGLVRARGGWFEPLNFYTLLVGESGQKKSPLLDELCTRPLLKVQREMKELQRLEQRLKDNEKGVQEKEEVWVKVKASLVDDGSGTGEGLRSWMSEFEQTQMGIEEMNPGVVVICDEISEFLGGMGQYSGTNATRSMVLKWFGGRGGGGSARKEQWRQTYLERANFSVIGGIQPAVLRQSLSSVNTSEAERHDGLMPRFTCLPQAPFTDIDFDSLPDEDRVNAAREALQDLMVRAFRLSGTTKLYFHEIGQRMMHNYSQEVSRKNSDPGLSAVERQITGKSAGKAMRIAGALHILKTLSESPGWGKVEGRIPTATLETAIKMQRLLDRYTLDTHLAFTFTAEQSLHEFLSSNYPHGGVASFPEITKAYGVTRRISGNMPNLGRNNEVGEMLTRYGCKKKRMKDENLWLIPPSTM